MSFSTEIQKAVYDRLINYAPLASALADNADMPGLPAVYDDVPQDAAFPYVTIGEDTLTEWDTDTELGSQSVVTIHTWSRQRGKAETKRIQGLLYNALHRHDLSIPGYNVIDCLREMNNSALDPDGHTRHGVSNFRIILQKL